MPKQVLLALLLSASAFAGPHPNWEAMRQQISTTFHIPNPLPGISDKNYGSFTPAQGVAADRVSYATSYDMRVPAIIYHPAGATITRHPALVIVNGHGGDKSSWYAWWAGILYARAGAVVLTYDPMGEYERNKERKSITFQHDEVSEPEQQLATRTAGQMVTDVMQAVTYLSNRRDVDPKRIAVLGFSMGSFVSAVTCSLDTRINSCVLVGGGNFDGPSKHWDHSKPMCEALPFQALSFLGDRGAALYTLNARRGPTLVINGTDDTVVGIPQDGESFFAALRTRTITQAGTNKNIFEYHFVPGGKHAPYFLTKDAAVWLDARLKFPDWTKKQLSALPEVKVGDWAREHHLPEANEKGFLSNSAPLIAIGADIRVLAREDLHAVPEAVWDSQNSSYIYETWLDRAKSAAENTAP